MLPLNIVHRPLPSGVDLWLVPVANCPFVAVELGLPLGVSSEPVPGLAAILSRILEQPPTGSQAEKAILRLEQVGVNLLSEVTWPYCCWTLQVQSDHLFNVLTGLGQLLRPPAVSASTCRHLTAKQAGLSQEAQRDDSILTALALARITGRPSLAGTTLALGSANQREGVTPASLQAYATAGATANGALLVLAGGLDPVRAADICRAAFASWPQHTPLCPRPLRVLDAEAVWCRTDGRTARVALALDLASLTTQPERWAGILTHLLEDLLVRELRTRRSLAYYVQSHAAGSMLIAQASVAPESVEQVLKELEHAVSLLNEASPAEISKAARLAMARDIMAMESTVEIAGRLFNEVAAAGGMAQPGWRHHWDWLQAVMSSAAPLQVPDLSAGTCRQVLVSPTPAGQIQGWDPITPDDLL